METRMTKRLNKDHEQMQKNYADVFAVKLVNNDIKHWIVGFKGAQGTIYDGEQFE
jgi:ubiquitin-conjugating enzyme E2 W